MAYQALYRVWRPQQFQDVVGQEHITKTIQHAIVSNKLTHAYLFTGPRGTGKTSAAKIIAKAINCEHGPALEPCNECETCRSITEGTNPDVIEMDAASNNSVDDVRDIRETVKYAPSSAKYKVYIIDEAHMLSIGAFNALLKTLEEPPGHVLFILATTEPHKIPITIISRCQRFDFKRISNMHIKKRMEEIVTAQEVAIDDEALELIAKTAEGGMRDALSLLDQAISYSDSRVTEADVLSIIGGVSQDFIATLAEDIQKQDVASLLHAVEYMMDEGKDPLRFLEDFVYYYRDVLLYKTLSTIDESLLYYHLDEKMKGLATEIEEKTIYKIIHELNESKQEMKWTTHPRVFLEMIFIKLTQNNRVISASPAEGEENTSILLNRIVQLESKVQQLVEKGVPVTQQETRPQKERKNRPARSMKPIVSREKVAQLLGVATKQHLQSLRNIWPDVLQKLQQQNIQAHAWIKEGKPVLCSDEECLLAFPYEIHAQQAMEEKNRTLFESILFQAFGHPIRLVAIYEQDWNEVKQSFIEERKHQEDGGTKTENLLIEEGKKLVGENLLEIVEE